MRAFRHRIGMAVQAVRELFARSKAYRIFSIVNAVLVLLIAFLPAWKIFPKATPGMYVPLHYNIYFGVDQFGPWKQLFVPAIFGAIILLVNIAVGAACFKKDRYIAWFLLGLTFCVELILLAAVTFMVLLNL